MSRSKKALQGPRPLTPEQEAVYAAEEAGLTDEERADMEALHAGLADGTIVERPDLKAHVEAMARATQEAMTSSTRITVRLSPVDLETLQQKAQEQGLPYQTLLKSVIHQYLTGQLVPRT
jgi:hypothetical protein